MRIWKVLYYTESYSLSFFLARVLWVANEYDRAEVGRSVRHRLISRSCAIIFILYAGL